MRVLKKGFTLIELSLAIAFIGVLSLSVALIIVNMISAYRRGLTLNQVNTVGAAITEDMRKTIKESPVRSAIGICDDFYKGRNDNRQTMDCEENEAMNLINVTKEARVTIGTNVVFVPVYGAFCTGNYSYVWNSGYFFSDDYSVESDSITISYKKSESQVNPTEIRNFKLLKVKDTKRRICQLQNKSDRYETNNVSKIDMGYLIEEPIDMLKNSDIAENNLAAYDLKIAVPVINEKSHSMFYKVSFILGTVQGGINIASKGNFCTAPKDLENSGVENFDYCSINKFNFAVQANGG